jgi:Tfp pilus assembly protein PilN
MSRINLLPRQYRLQSLLWTRLREWAVMCAVCWTILLPAWWIKQSEFETAAESLDPLEQSYASLVQLQADNRRMRIRLNDVGNQENVLGGLQSEPPALATVAATSSSARRGQGRVWLQELSYVSRRELAPVVNSADRKAQASKAPVIVRELSLKGIGRDNIAISKFVLALRSTGLFAQVDLKAAILGAQPDSNEITYQVDCRF